MAIVKMKLDPNAASYTDDEIVAKVNAATAQITRAGAVSAEARPIGTGEVSDTHLASGVAQANLNAMSDAERGYIKSAPSVGEYRVVTLQRDSSGKLDIGYDDQAIT